MSWLMSLSSCQLPGSGSVMSMALQVMFGNSCGMTLQGPRRVALSGCGTASPATCCMPFAITPMCTGSVQVLSS